MKHTTTRPCRLERSKKEWWWSAVHDFKDYDKARQLAGMGDASSQLTLLAAV